MNHTDFVITTDKCGVDLFLVEGNVVEKHVRSV